MPDARVLLADDEPLVRDGLRHFAQRDGRLQLIGEARSGDEAIALSRQLRPDLLLLDVQMPGCDGFAVIEALGPAVPAAVVFVTAFDRYAIRAFEHHAVDYLLKPFEEERFTVAVTRALQRLAPGRVDWPGVLAEVRQATAAPRRFLVRDDGRTVVVPIDDIDWIEAADNYVKLHTKQRVWMLREPMRDVERHLEGSGFARIHRSTIVNLARVREMQPLFGGEQAVILTTGARLTLSRGYRDAFRARLSSG